MFSLAAYPPFVLIIAESNAKNKEPALQAGFTMGSTRTVLKTYVERPEQERWFLAVVSSLHNDETSCLSCQARCWVVTKIRPSLLTVILL
jgi:hypothetical protein